MVRLLEPLAVQIRKPQPAAGRLRPPHRAFGVGRDVGQKLSTLCSLIAANHPRLEPTSRLSRRGADAQYDRKSGSFYIVVHNGKQLHVSVGCVAGFVLYT